MLQRLRHVSMVPQHLLNMKTTWMNGMLPSIAMNKDVPSTVWKELLAPQVELDSVRQPTSGGVSLWEFWLWSPQGNQPDARQMARLLVTNLHFNITSVPRADSLVCDLQLHVHIEPLWGREAGYHRTEAVCQHRTMETCTQHQSSKFPQCAGCPVRRNAGVKTEVKTSHQRRAGSPIASWEPFHTEPQVFLWHV